MFKQAFEKTAALDLNKVKGMAMGAARTIKNKPAMAVAGALGGAATGAMAKDEYGQRGGVGGAVKGALLGGATGAAATLAHKKYTALNRFNAAKNVKPPSVE